MFDVIIEVIAFLLVVGYPAAIVYSVFYHRRLKRERSAITLESFAPDLADAGFPRSAIEATFCDFKKRFGYPVLPGDRLYETLGLSSEDLEDMVECHLEANGIEDIEKTEMVSLLPLLTVRDYVAFLSALPSFRENARGQERP